MIFSLSCGLIHWWLPPTSRMISILRTLAAKLVLQKLWYNQVIAQKLPVGWEHWVLESSDWDRLEEDHSLKTSHFTISKRWENSHGNFQLWKSTQLGQKFHATLFFLLVFMRYGLHYLVPSLPCASSRSSSDSTTGRTVVSPGCKIHDFWVAQLARLFRIPQWHLWWRAWKELNQL